MGVGQTGYKLSGMHASGGRQAGHSLLELMIVVTLVAVLAAVAIPSFTRMAASSAVSSNVNALLGSFDQARSEAIARNVPVVVCRATGLTAATPACSDAAVGAIAAADWASGWIVYAKPEGSQALAAYDPATDQLLRRFEADGMRASGDRSSIVPNPATPMVGWTGNGLRAGDGLQVPTFIVDHREPALASPSDLARCLRLSVIGRSRAGTLALGVCND